ncbi:hypothetical protein A5692_04855 [Mycobacterium sp. E342]|uniref:hypothetical protein n=1 Tax=Mycobacterium sp. E342 TaxID=1834147 RepID=UPI000800EC6F|nr:hypothetical protein [Mycobacterium sp. E342]OBH24379.1 hypothetical protein A5692_04855 [Mycobacterium sp. E342]
MAINGVGGVGGVEVEINWYFCGTTIPAIDVMAAGVVRTKARAMIAAMVNIRFALALALLRIELLLFEDLKETIKR